MYLTAHPNSLVTHDSVDAAVSSAKFAHVDWDGDPKEMVVYEVREVRRVKPPEPLRSKRA